MAWIKRHQGRDGKVNIERVCGMVRTQLTKERAVKEAEGFNAAKSTHKDALNEDRLRNGWSGEKKNFRRIARVPAEQMRAFRKVADPTDTKAMKSFIRENQYYTVARNSF